jgi:hypothetical protein
MDSLSRALRRFFWSPFKEGLRAGCKQKWVRFELLRCNFLFLRIISIQRWWLFKNTNCYPISFLPKQVFKCFAVENIVKVYSQIILHFTWPFNKTHPAHNWESNTRILLQTEFCNDTCFYKFSHSVFILVLIVVFFLLKVGQAVKTKGNDCIAHLISLISYELKTNF